MSEEAKRNDDDDDDDIDDTTGNAEPELERTAESPQNEVVIDNDAAQNAVDAAYERWVSQQVPMTGWCTYATAIGRIAGITGDPELRACHEYLAEVPMRARHWHMAPQVVAPAMLFDPMWVWKLEGNYVHKRTMPDYPEHRLWVEVHLGMLEQRLGLGVQPQSQSQRRADEPARVVPFHVADGSDRAAAAAGLRSEDAVRLDELRAMRSERRSARRGEDADELAELECRICEAEPETSMRDLAGMPPGWRAIGRLEGDLLVCCPSCLNLLRAL